MAPTSLWGLHGHMTEEVCEGGLLYPKSEELNFAIHQP